MSSLVLNKHVSKGKKDFAFKNMLHMNDADSQAPIHSDLQNQAI